ncbi:hypothetical protein [Deinococcus wulumuqiensis]|uniref:Uncharacterized protein n=1 Tax=Deinococcus wulumuqiensis TaxID=980427 RepID=A0AAV4KAD6_9DEIO|nr:hypothetical protein [Deinococcus wulumuqiensis]QII21659.1 hypothetical protein G6R31_13760 [Deinococcus wulumuqiensis R12]GGI91034.1 hypothetical protein GCM10010914_26760 [Deinococcus wulumuqiensis]GGP30917.1 hypothetical protein GCM10008021_25680 [Deinococcus wulumuqiensis]
MLWLFLGIFGPPLAVGFFFARRQARLDRAMDAMDDSRREAGYVGPHVPGPY